VTLLIALLGAAVLLSGLVLLAGFRRRGEEPRELAPADVSRESDLVDAGPSANTWMFGGAGGQG
jgi:hypothetical protein